MDANGTFEADTYTNDAPRIGTYKFDTEQWGHKIVIWKSENEIKKQKPIWKSKIRIEKQNQKPKSVSKNRNQNPI